MPGKRRAVLPMLYRRPRLAVAVAMVVLLYLVVGLWAAFGRRPAAVSLVPAPPIFPAGSAEASSADAGSASSEASAAAPVPSAGSAEPEPEPEPDDGPGNDRERPPPTRSAPPAEVFTSRYTVTENGSRTFHARVFLTNRGSTTRNWSVRISFAPSDQVRVGLTLGAIKRSSGDTVVFSGFRARPGQTEVFGFDATKGVQAAVRPTACEVDGRDCEIRLG